MPPGSVFGRHRDVKLLRLVKQYPELYDPNHESFSVSDAREIAWQKISDEIHIPSAEFAGIQCQIQFGDYNEEKHKPGFIENLSEYLPEQYCSSWGIEKKILKEYSTHAGLNELEAKHLYTKIARALPTYGVTFFLVKEKQKGKKKLVPRLLGINAESILRLDETTKEIIQTWPLTHVKTYHAGKGETFTLNFGDYTDKEYSVKTRDAFRIRDILEGYIDLIRKRMLAHYNVSTSEHGYVGQDNITCGQANVVQHMSNNPSKVVEHSFVGPSKIIQLEPGQRASSVGTQVVTAQQLLISEMKTKQEQGILKADVSMRKDMGVPFTRRLNRLNSNSVKIVTLLTEPSQTHLEDAHKIANDMNADMPTIRDGVANTIAKQPSEEEKKKLQDQMNELDELMRSLCQHTNPASANSCEAEEAAKRVASLSTEMYFAIAPESRRRSSILNKTRNSFIADERTEKNLRRASFIAATATTNHALDSATELATEEYKGPTLSRQQIKDLENAAVDKLGKINAAIAHYLLAHSDPQNIDYSTAVNSLNTIHELVPDLARDGQALASVRDDKDRTELVNDIKELCAAAKHLCSLSGVEDPQKLQEASSKYADVSGRLVYVFGRRGGKGRADKENQIIDLTEQVVDKTSQLLNSAQALAQASPADPASKLVDEAGAATAQAAKQLMKQTTLNAPTIEEPHCQSALTAASEALSSSVQLLAASWKPLVEHPSRHVQGERLHNQTMELAKALDTLRDAYSGLGETQCSLTDATSKTSSEPGTDVEAQRLKFINSLSKIGGNWKTAEEDLNKPGTSSVKDTDASEAQARLSERLGQLNAAIASLLSATTDRDNPDYKTAEVAITTIDELMPEIVKDSRIASANQDEASRAALLANIKELCAASKKVCASAYGAEPGVSNEAIVQFTESSGKLTYVVNRRANPDTETQLIEATSAACAQVGVLLSGVQQVSEAVRDARGEALDARGAAVADAARALFTTAQVTAPSISDPRCQSTLLNAIDKVSSTTDTLEQTWKPLAEDEKYEKIRVQALDGARKQLDKQLDKIRTICQTPYDDETQTQQTQIGSNIDEAQEQQKLRFVTTLRAAKDKLAEARNELNKPAMPAKGSNVEAVQHRLNQGLEQLNAAIASLLAATADRENPDCAVAERATDTITKLMPQLIRDTKTVSGGKEESARAAMLAEIEALCDASERICASSYGTDTKGVNEAVMKYSEASGKLMYVANPRLNRRKEKEVLEQVESACGATAVLLTGVQQLAEGVGGDRGRELDDHGGRLADAAQNMLHTAQITSSCVSSPECRAVLGSAVAGARAAAGRLSGAVRGARGAHAHHLATQLHDLQLQLEHLRETCDAPDEHSHIDASPPSPRSPPPPLPASKPPVVQAVQKAPHSKLTQEFLDRLRMEEGLGKDSSITGPAVVQIQKSKPSPPVRRTDDEKTHCSEFDKSLQEAQKSIKAHESELMKQCRSPSGASPALSHSDMNQKQTRLQRHLALAGVEVAHLVDANYADKTDYSTALKSTKALPQLMSAIVEDGTQLADNLNEMARKAFLYEMMQLCEAGRKISEVGLADRQKLNDAAVHFGDTSTKLLYLVSNDVDPALEKEIISRAKAIGDSASRLALDAADVASAGAGTSSSSVQAICDAGTACVDAAGKLVYTAKLTAPSIHEVPCQDALVSATETLSAKLKKFAHSWTPLESDPKQANTIAHLSKEAANLEEILAGLRSDVKEGTIGRRRELEHLIVEDTPIRKLTVKILEEAKNHAESSSLPAQEKIAYASYADKLTDALRALDLAAARCKKSPHDTEKRRDLERAVQNLQMILLQSRPSRGEKGKTNIVDLMDFMEEVAGEAENVSVAASTANVASPQDKLALEEIRDKCDLIHSKGNKLITGEIASDLDFNDLFDQFGQECEDTIKMLNADVKRLEDAKAKKLIQSKVLALSESCNMLRFATKSGISTEACCSLDASLDQLDDIEARVINSIVQDAASPGVTLRIKKPPQTVHSPASIKLCREVTSSPTGVEASAVTAYIADAASRTDGSPEDKNRLLKHLYKLVHLLKTLTVTSSARAATWQPVQGPDTTLITDQILQEIYKPESKFGVKPEDTTQKILEEDLIKILIPSAPKILGDKKQQEDKLTQLTSQLSATCSDLSHSVSRNSPQDASRGLSQLSRVAADHARELDGISRGVHIIDPVQRRRIDEAAKEMSFATYNVLKTAESACLEPKNTNLKRRLTEALENLNQSIDKLVWHSSTSPVLSRACRALSRGTAAQLAALEPRPVTSAPFHDTCEMILKQNEHISKLKSDQPMARAEFMRDLDDIGTAVRTSVDCAAQCAYYIAVSDKDKDIAKSGVVDVPHIQKTIESIQDSCMAVIGSSQIDQAKEQKEDLHQRVSDFSTALEQAQMLVKDGDVKRTLLRAKSCISDAAADLEAGLEGHKEMKEVTPKAVSLLEAVNTAHSLIEQCPLVPAVGEMSTDTKAKCDEVMNHSKSLLTNTLALLKEVEGAPEDPELMTWVTFNTNRKKLLDAYDALLKTVRRNGHRTGIYDKAPEEENKEQTKKSYIEIQVDLVNKWLKSPACKAEVKASGQQAARNVIDMARQMSEDLKGGEREEVRGVITETEELLAECSKKYNHEKNSLLMDRMKELRKSIQRGVVTRVVEDFIEADAPLADLDLLADIEPDESKRKFILERKIASLLAQLGRVTKTARFVASATQQQTINLELTQTSEQTELLAPMLVKAAQQRIDHPDDKAVIENYKALLAQYAESISKVRDLCDRAVDPMDFVQTAGETMQRMREDMSQQSTDTQKCANASSAITKLANRVINVSMSSNAVASDPELQKALVEAKKRLHAVTPAPNTRASRLPDWRDTTAEILRTTGDVESALGGENIFKKEPTTANQPIYSVARSLHESVREWSSRDNEIVGVARRMAVLMARLSEYMETDKKDALITTSKSIVAESQEVTELAKKLAHECTDVRIKTNLLQTCERIPTISGQLKMLTTVKASSLGQQAVEEDKEAMDMLVGNAQSLMMSISDVVKAAAGASVKIMSQRGPRLRWVRKTYY